MNLSKRVLIKLSAEKIRDYLVLQKNVLKMLLNNDQCIGKGYIRKALKELNELDDMLKTERRKQE